MITVLWEDQRAAQASAFGPHVLLLACVSDDTGKDRWGLRDSVIAVPKKGNANVLVELRRSTRPQVLAVLDWDRAPELAGVQGTPCFSSVRESLAAKHEPTDRRRVVFLRNNVESLLLHASKVLNVPPPTSKPSPNQRDVLLAKLAHHGDSKRRADLRSAIPSFDYLVTRVCQLL